MTAKKDRKLTANLSFLQLYNEKIYDLLNESTLSQQSKTSLKLKWNTHDVYTVENLTQVEITKFDEILDCYNTGVKNKAIGTHKMNLSSSRSHTVFTITLEQVKVSNPDNTIVSKFQIVDLAGSERQSQTGTEGQTQKESIEINKSLFVLRQVITALTQQAINSKETVYVPYRDSKLTMLLRQSLGGNATSLMIACLQPS